MDLIRETEFSAFSCGSSNINVVKGGFMPAKILLFEDEVSIRSVLSELLTDAGYEVVAVGDGVTGLAQYRKEQFDLVYFGQENLLPSPEHAHPLHFKQKLPKAQNLPAFPLILLPVPAQHCFHTQKHQFQRKRFRNIIIRL